MKIKLADRIAEQMKDPEFEKAYLELIEQEQKEKDDESKNCLKPQTDV